LVLATFSNSSQRQSYADFEGATATNTSDALLLPLIFKQPTHTPTATPTTTATPTVTPTGTPSNCGTGFNGHLEKTDNKPSYATYIERIRFNEFIHNPTSSTICFGILGISVTGPQTLPFKTSWDGAGAPNGRLEIWAGCHGPTGMPCAGSAGAGMSQDHLGDGEEEHNQFEITTPGNYNATLFVCYSPFSDCLAPGGNWVGISGAVPFTMIHWTPSAHLDGEPAEPTMTPSDEPICYLITDDPAGIYLDCEGNVSEGMAHSRP
jgi:hypothetical protein